MRFLLGLGSNLGDRTLNLCDAISSLRSIGIISSTSYLYESKPMGMTKQPSFLNAACSFETPLDPVSLLRECKKIEHRLGRKSTSERWGPREIDIDILFSESLVKSWPSSSSNGDLIVPHKSVKDREFVLRPLCDIAPDFIHPQEGRTLSSLLKDLVPSGALSQTVSRVLPIGRGRVLPLGVQTYVMGILNTTPDSFSDGGLFSHSVMAAVQQGLRMENMGAHFLDVGGESTRPHATLVPESEELKRVIPVIEQLRRQTRPETVISIDTTKALVAKEAINAGADIVNDISGGKYDACMLPTVSSLNAPIILMHNRGTPETMDKLCHYDDLIPDVSKELNISLEYASREGIPKWMCIIDPGIGFAKNTQQNLSILRHLKQIRAYLGDIPVLVGTSRKRFIGEILGENDPKGRVYGTAATVAVSVAGGADIIRVHDVHEMAQVSKVSDSILRIG